MSTHNHSSNILAVGKTLPMRLPPRDGRTRDGVFTLLAARFTEWRDRRAAAADLARLSDRELADIGLTRQQIPQALTRNR